MHTYCVYHMYVYVYKKVHVNVHVYVLVCVASCMYVRVLEYGHYMQMYMYV
jgi:hypothetical protein